MATLLEKKLMRKAEGSVFRPHCVIRLKIVIDRWNTWLSFTSFAGVQCLRDCQAGRRAYTNPVDSFQELWNSYKMDLVSGL